MPLYGIDVSHYQGAMDWNRVAREGFAFAYAKATQGTGFTDSRFRANIAGMRKAGLIPGAYHFLEHGNATAQARHFCSVAGNLDDALIVLDVEASGATASDAKAWIAEVKKRTGNHPVLLYLPMWYWARIGRPDLRATGADGLVASRYLDYTRGAASVLYQRVPSSHWQAYGGMSPVILQFSSSGIVAGKAPVDVDAFRGTRAELAKFTTEPKDTTFMGVEFKNEDDLQAFLRKAVWGENFNVWKDLSDGAERLPHQVVRVGAKNAYLARLAAEALGSTDKLADAVAAKLAGGDVDIETVKAGVKAAFAEMVADDAQA